MWKQVGRLQIALASLVILVMIVEHILILKKKEKYKFTFKLNKYWHVFNLFHLFHQGCAQHPE